jgi:Na+/H+ antiporter 1
VSAIPLGPASPGVVFVLTRPLQLFVATEAHSAIPLLGATTAALVWANSPWLASYEALWSTSLSVQVGEAELSKDLRHWVNDGLMTLFFLVVGLEVSRQLRLGELRHWQTAAVEGGDPQRRSRPASRHRHDAPRREPRHAALVGIGLGGGGGRDRGLGLPGAVLRRGAGAHRHGEQGDQGNPNAHGSRSYPPRRQCPKRPDRIPRLRRSCASLGNWPPLGPRSR